MKTLLLVFILSLSFTFHAQNEISDKKIFVRVYDFNGKKIAKGKTFKISDTTITFSKKGKLETLHLSQIGSIKTKRSGGHNILMGASIAGGLTTLVAISSGGESFYEGYSGLGILVFSAAGGGIGAITNIGKNSNKFLINGSAKRWATFKESILSD